MAKASRRHWPCEAGGGVERSGGAKGVTLRLSKINDDVAAPYRVATACRNVLDATRRGGVM